MKRLIAAGAVAACALTFGAPAVQAAVPISGPAAGAASISDDIQFYALVTNEEPALGAISGKKLVKTAKTTCRYLRTAGTILDAHDLMTESGFTDDQATAFIAGAIVFYCPDQEDNF